MKNPEENSAFFRFYEELNDFLPSTKKKQEFAHPFKNPTTIKDAIETIGIPHTEIDLILVNGHPVGFDYLLQNGDHVSVYPTFESMDISKVSQLRPTPLREIKFILDVHLGKLAKYLRLLGFDCLFETTFQDDEITKISHDQHRIVLTRDKNLLKNSLITHGHWVHKIVPKEQLKEIITRFDLTNKISAFARCLECNGSLVKVDKNKIAERLPANTNEYYQQFFQCPQCKRIYWEGPHYQKMQTFIEELLTQIKSQNS